MDEEERLDGVWRTVSGRRVYIVNGQIHFGQNAREIEAIYKEIKNAPAYKLDKEVYNYVLSEIATNFSRFKNSKVCWIRLEDYYSPTSKDNIYIFTHGKNPTDINIVGVIPIENDIIRKVEQHDN